MKKRGILSLKSDTKNTPARSLFADAKNLYNQGRGVREYSRGFALLKEAAQKGFLQADEWLGFVYHCGVGTRRNLRLAFKHYKIAADAGHPNAEYHVGVFYDQGVGVKKDRDSALVWIRRAASHGSASATYWLGWFYLNMSDPKSKRRGFRLVLSAAERGEPQAQHAIAICYEEGEGVKSDLAAAFRWYVRAATRGYPFAVEAVARCYENGIGTRANRQKSQFWLRRVHSH
jgi:TPR repeat protein